MTARSLSERSLKSKCQVTRNPWGGGAMPVTRRGPRGRLLVAFLFCGLSGAGLSAGADDAGHAGAVAATALAGDLAATPVEGQASDIAPFAYAYRKGAANNPMETRWLNPTPELLCGLLWEERRSVRRIEVEFPLAPATAPRRRTTAAGDAHCRRTLRGGVGPRLRPRPPAGVYAQARRGSGRDARRARPCSPSRPRTTSTA